MYGVRVGFVEIGEHCKVDSGGCGREKWEMDVSEALQIQALG
jgi:hypothetical protein